jgi:hypothetical protein
MIFDTNKLYKYGFLALCVVIVIAVVVLGIERRAQQELVTKLQNDVAQRDQTIEVQKGVYHKLSIESEGLQKLLTSKDEEMVRLNKELKKSKEQLLTANSLVVQWKKAYEAVVTGNQSDVNGENGVVRKKVEFSKDFGYIGVSGFTLTDPPEASVRVQQNRPLKLSLIVSQDDSGAWHTRTTSSEDNVNVQIDLAAVDPKILEPRWYEGIGFVLDVGMGSQFLAGAGVTYKIGRFELGPKAWFGIPLGQQPTWAAGLQVLWHPFAR